MDHGFGTIYTNLEMGNYSKAYTSNYGDKLYDIGYTFPVRRMCRIFKGTTVVAYLYAGGKVVCNPYDGSQGGEEHPYRLMIRGYIKNGKYYNATAEHGVNYLWFDTDYEIGYSMYNEATTYTTGG
ncbi:hypothetical protein BN1058_02778 [Paraliobacillus sp. PM-2]|uniref:hypothetical protein n=1 Tax=Paraliobacillus sp. PM-2 TaxID=1462524 RepID=UPI00061CC506|nr:hypothetical protein [Paraliobacillus sp. PM-2]CQR48409.1 hypothetical protein BN1058_02778 [Paraliobacillus sp. PM-2]